MRVTITSEDAERILNRLEGKQPPDGERVDRETGGILDDRWLVPHPDTFGGQDFLKDKRLDDLLESVLEDFEADFDWLAKYRIRILWKRKGSGKHPLGTCQVASGLVGYFSDVDFVICLAANLIRMHGFTEKQMRALVYHELMHCNEEGEDPKPTVRGHDLEVFASELTHFGAWLSDIEAMRPAFRQLEMSLGGES